MLVKASDLMTNSDLSRIATPSTKDVERRERYQSFYFEIMHKLHGFDS
jgi:hypothetical protein